MKIRSLIYCRYIVEEQQRLILYKFVDKYLFA